MIKKLISIIIPAYNAEEYLAETVESVLNQTNSDLELIVVIDGATDNTENIAHTYESDNRVKVISKINSGVSDTRNVGFSASKGEYIAFLDADDVWLPERLAKMKLAFDENKKIGLVHTDMAIIDEKSIKNGNVLTGKEGDLLDSLLLWDGTNIPGPSSVLVKREVIEKVGGFDTRLSTAADQEFFFRVASKYKIGRIAEPLGLYRVHNQNMHQNIALMEKDHVMAYRIAKEHNLFKSQSFRRKCFAKLYLILAGSWWKEGNNKLRAIQFIIKSVFTSPLVFFKYRLCKKK
jgi:glycosyltransferase involved in cell wall biosynthesis